MRISADIVVVGSGLAGLSLALEVANRGFRVAILTKESLTENSSYYAQGGIAAVWSDEDTFESHVSDTLQAGAGLCDEQVVDFVVRNGPKSVQWLIDHGVSFSRRDQLSKHPEEYHLTQEGGHSSRRVMHAADTTGQTVETTLLAKVVESDLIDVYEKFTAIELITQSKTRNVSQNHCLGVYAQSVDSEQVYTFVARSVVLATGGAAKAYLYTSNPDSSTGDGIAMAWRAGCRVANMEFVQFHPTCLFHPHAKRQLITEALRGEGAKLLLPNGRQFMKKYDERGELAPRDIVARAIDNEMKTGGLEHVLLDISFKSEDFLHSHFPGVYNNCNRFGIDITKEPIPVVPAAHYTCGGAMVDQNGQTDLHGLYCIGESAFTGLHGANRLASNSLLECLVYAHSAVRHIEHNIPEFHNNHAKIPDWDESQVTDPDEMVVIHHNWHELRRFMWNYVGIVRTEKRLTRAHHRIELLREEVREFYSQFRVNRDLIELRNLVQVAQLIVNCALSRKESRGLHYMLEHPETRKEFAQTTVLNPNNP